MIDVNDGVVNFIKYAERFTGDANKDLAEVLKDYPDVDPDVAKELFMCGAHSLAASNAARNLQ